MAYGALEQQDPDHHHGDHSDDHYDSTPPVSPIQRLASLTFAPPLSLGELFLDHENNNTNEVLHDVPQSTTFRSLVHSIASRSTKKSSSYDMVEDEDYAEEIPTETHQGSSVPTHIPRLPPLSSPRTDLTPPATSAEETNTSISTPSLPNAPIVRTASGHRAALRHPTPDLQSHHGSYTGNIQHLERTAERLSMTSSIDDAIRDLHSEQKRNDSRRSSPSSPDIPTAARQVSNNPSSIVETNNIARTGGYSPAAFMMSPKSSLTTGGRRASTSKGSRFDTRPEPELEGRPLESFVDPPVPGTLTALSQPTSIAGQGESYTSFTRRLVDVLDEKSMVEIPNPRPNEERPATSASVTTFDQAQKMFADFDGVHSAPPQNPTAGNESENLQQRTVSWDRQSIVGSDSNDLKRSSSANRLSMAVLPSYSDPSTGQQMVYYPAPVPMMLNLPQKLSKMPSSMARNKRRSQVLSTLPPLARQAAIWLPDVLEIEDEPNLPENDEAQQQEYLPQHQRASMGGRRLTQDLQHVPPQLRATVFFDLPAPGQTVEIKEQSAVATLDSILDASAHAPVNAFTDHAYAGPLGAEVYGRESNRNKSSRFLQAGQPPKKRASAFNLLRGRRASSSDLLETENEKRRATISDIRAGGILDVPDEDDDEDDEDTEHDAGGLGDEIDPNAEDVYHGAPTTLLAELQLRKQQQKYRTRHLASQYPNGIRSTLLELDAVAQVEQKSRKHKRIHLAWEDPADQLGEDDSGDDEDVPLAMLYAKKSQVQDPNRPMGLMERRDMEDNEPLSRRRDRLQGRPPAMNRASTMMNLQANAPDEEGETLAQRLVRLKEQGRALTGLPTAGRVSGDFASELMSQLGVDNVSDAKVKGKEGSDPAPEDETLGQRRKRLQAERDARAKEVAKAEETQEFTVAKKRTSLANILQAHPSAGGVRASQIKPATGLLGMHEQENLRRASTMFNLDASHQPGPPQAQAAGFKSGMYNNGQGGIIIPPQYAAPQQQTHYNMFSNTSFPQQFPQPSLGYNGFGNHQMTPFANPYAMAGAYGNGGMMGMNMGYMPTMQHVNPMASMSMLQMGAGVQPLNQGQIDMVERWRQSVMQ